MEDKYRNRLYWVLVALIGAGCLADGCVRSEEPRDMLHPDTIITSGPAPLTDQTSAAFTFICTEAPCTFKCEIDGGGLSSCASPWDYTDLTDGSHTFRVQATDIAGNTDPTPAIYLWIIDQIKVPDTTPPSAPNLTATAISCTQIALSWSGSTDNLTPQSQLRYEIWWSTTTPVSTAGLENALTGAGVTAYAVTGLTGGTYYFKVKALDEAGNLSGESNEANAAPKICWARSYGGTSIELAWSIQPTSDGGYIVAGETDSFGAGSGDFWVLKLNGDGSIAWQKAYGGTLSEWAYFVQQTVDGGYIATGRTDSFSIGFIDDFWVLKLNGDGSIAWQKTYGGALTDVAYSTQQTSDGGYIVAGSTYSFGAGSSDFWVLKLNGDGSVAWERAYGGPFADSAYSVQQTTDGGCIVAGETNSFGILGRNLWVLKLNGDGSIAWQKAYVGTYEDLAFSIQQTMDGGYIVAGYTDSFGAGSGDFWILKLNGDGSIAWQRSYGGQAWDFATSIRQTADGGYIVAGLETSFGTGGYDFWVMKLLPDGLIFFNPSSGASVTDTTATVTDTTATVTTTTGTMTGTSATVTTTSANVTDTNATITQQAP